MSGKECIYFFSCDERNPDIIKIGRSGDIINRLRNYNTGRIKEIELKYLAIVKNAKLIEKCMKYKLIDKQYVKNKEIYTISNDELKNIIDECYCKNVSKESNDALYKELSELLGLYSYTKDKVNIKPFVIFN